MTLMPQKTNLKGMTREEMEEFAASLGEKPFRGRQLFNWIYCRRVCDFFSMTDISIPLKKRLQQAAYVSSLELLERRASDSGDTEKFLFGLEDGNIIESVLMRYDEQGAGRCTVCISSQAGCSQGCAFCASGRAGLVRNLEAGEIVDQVVSIQRLLDGTGQRVHNVVIMGIGEPLLNYDNVVKAIRLINHGDGTAIGMRRLAISTVGIPHLIRKFAGEKFGLRFAVSLHAPDDETRSRIMPVNRRHPIGELVDACRYYQQATGRRITFEYALIEGLNDSMEAAEKLARLLSGIHLIVNLIPLNPVEGFPYRRPGFRHCQAFCARLEELGLNAALRTERGTGIDASCGQLRLRRMEELC